MPRSQLQHIEQTHFKFDTLVEMVNITPQQLNSTLFFCGSSTASPFSEFCQLCSYTKTKVRLPGPDRANMGHINNTDCPKMVKIGILVS